MTSILLYINILGIYHWFPKMYAMIAMCYLLDFLPLLFAFPCYEFYDYYINEVIHKEIVDELRVEFPSTKIFTIPTGWATKNLAQMNLDDELLDDISMVGPKSSSIFTDEKGHQGQIVIETGTMIWLNSIYNVDLSSFNYDTGFTTDLHAIAQDIIDSHDSNYEQ